MDVAKIQELLDLIDRVSIPPPGMDAGELPDFNSAIIARAVLEVESELVLP